MAEQPAHIGEELRAARERDGRSLGQIARELNIPERYLHAIETGSRDGLPGVGYVLGYVRAYASEVGFKPDLAVDRYKAEQAIPRNLRLRDAPHIVTKRSRQLPRAIVPAALVVASAVGFALYYGWNSGRTDMGPERVATAQQAPEALDANTVVLRAQTASWIEITATVDGAGESGSRESGSRETVFSGIMVPGQVLTYDRDKLPMMHVRDAGAIRLELGEEVVGPLGRRGQTVKGLSAEEVIQGARVEALPDAGSL